MKIVLIVILMSLLALASTQYVSNRAYQYSTNAIEARQGIVKDVNIQIPNFLTSAVQIAKQVPYVEVLKLVEAFLRFKGEIAGRAWAIVNDNSHIIAALRDTLIAALPTLHNLTLNSIIVLRKVLEFASNLFSNVNVNIGSSGGSFSYGR